MRHILLPITAVLVFSCVTEDTSENKEKELIETVQVSKADRLIQDAIIAHGGDLYNQAHYKFSFRDKLYTFQNDNENYTYTSEYQTDRGWQIDELINGDFNRSLDDKQVVLSEEEGGKYGESLNSVIYFATLPLKLSDPSVNSEYIGITSIDSVNYETVMVTFSQVGGGQDFQDEYCYWINSETKRVDYLAYNYQVNGGGARFRSSYNTRDVDGIIFQDYINHTAELSTPLIDLPSLYEMDSLEEVSRIELVNVKSIN
jgi:hypothetical protein